MVEDPDRARDILGDEVAEIPSSFLSASAVASSLAANEVMSKPSTCEARVDRRIECAIAEGEWWAEAVRCPLSGVAPVEYPL